MPVAPHVPITVPARRLGPAGPGLSHGPAGWTCRGRAASVCGRGHCCLGLGRSRRQSRLAIAVACGSRAPHSPESSVQTPKLTRTVNGRRGRGCFWSTAAANTCQVKTPRSMRKWGAVLLVACVAWAISTRLSGSADMRRRNLGTGTALRAVVTGATGATGRHVVQQLLQSPRWAKVCPL